MAAGRIKGITIEIGGDSTKLTSALAKVDNALNKTQSNLRDLNKALKLDPGNADLIKDKQLELNKAIEDTKSKLETEKQALAQMQNTEGFDKNSQAARDLKIQIDLDTAALKELESQARQSSSVLGAQMQAAGEKIQAVGDKIKGVGDKISGLGQTMTTSVTVPIVSAFGASAKAAIDWESAFTGVMKTVDETATTSYADLKNSINEIAKTTASSQNEIAGVMEIAGQLGVSADSITDFTKAVVMLGDTTNLSAEEAASSIARFANVTNMSLNETDKFGSALVDLGNNFATTESDILNMATRLSGAGAQIGLSQGEILGFATALSSVGIEAEMGGSAFSKAMIKMQVAAETGYEPVIELSEKTGMSLRELELLSANNSKDFKALADSLGLTATEMNATIKAGNNLEDFAKVANMSTEQFVKLYRDDAPAAMQAFIQGLGDVEGHGESTIAMLQDMGFTEVRLRDTLTRLANSGDLVTDAVSRGNKAWSENTAMTAEAEKRYATMAAKIQQLKNRITEVAVGIGETLMPYIEKAMDYVEGLVEKWKALDDEHKEAILKFAAIAAAVGPLLIIIGKVVASVGSIVSVVGHLVSGIGTLLSSIGGLSGVLAALASPIGIAVAAITALVAGFTYLYTTNDKFRESINQTIASLKENFARIVEQIKPRLEALGQAFQGLMDALAPVFEAIFTVVMGVINGILEALAPITDVIINMVDMITNIVQAFLALLQGDFDGFFTHMIGVLNNYINIITGLVQAFINYVTAFFKTFGINLETVFKDIWNKIKTVTSSLLDNIKTGIQDKWTDIKDWLKETLEKIYETFKEIFEKIKEGVSEKIDNVKEAIVDGIGAAAEFVESLPEKFYNWGLEMIENLIAGITKNISSVGEAISSVADVIASYIHFTEPDVGPLSNFHTFMPDMINEMVNGINKSIPRLENAMSGLASGMASQLQTSYGAGSVANTNNINISVYGSDNMNVSELVDTIEERISENIMRRGVAFG